MGEGKTCQSTEVSLDPAPGRIPSSKPSHYQMDLSLLTLVVVYVPNEEHPGERLHMRRLQAY